jgi:hypothetical protein
MAGTTHVGIEQTAGDSNLAMRISSQKGSVDTYVHAEILSAQAQFQIPPGWVGGDPGKAMPAQVD